MTTVLASFQIIFLIGMSQVHLLLFIKATLYTQILFLTLSKQIASSLAMSKYKTKLVSWKACSVLGKKNAMSL